MGNIDELLPQVSPTVQAILDYWEAKGNEEKPRGYLGMSEIGHECEARLWYSFRHAARPTFDGRMRRLFNRGHREEEVFAEELRGAGLEVITHQEDGEQIGFVAVYGHYKGHMDAAILGVKEAPKTWHVGEFKTHSLSSFRDLKKKGVKASKPVHYAQMQAYMKYSGMTRALYLAVCKDNDELYSERVRYDASFAQGLEDKAERIIFAAGVPPRIATRPDDYRCRYCPAHAICWGSQPPEPAVPVPSLSCRQCVHATPTKEGGWHCEKHNRPALEPCEDHLFLPSLITFATPNDAHKDEQGRDIIEFKNNADGSTWYHGPDSGAGHYTSEDLITLPFPLINQQGAVTKDEAGNLEPDLATRFSSDDMVTVFTGTLMQAIEAWNNIFEEPLPEHVADQEREEWSVVEFPGSRCLMYSADQSYAEIRIFNHPDNEWHFRLSQKGIIKEQR